VRGIALRAIRKLLRRLDAALAAGEAQNIAAELAPGTNGCERMIDEFLSSVTVSNQGASRYFREHRQRLARTLSLLPLGNAASRALELGSYLHMAAALERVLGYGFVRAAYYSPSLGHETKSLPIGGQRYTTEVDLFDAESDDFPYPESAFDLVLCCEVIEHLIHDPMHMLLESWRVLANDGQIVLTTPNIASLSSVSAVLEGRQNPQVFSRYPPLGNADTPHVREYTPHEIDQMLRSAGFEVTYLFTERLREAQHATWVFDVLRANRFETRFRGEQIYCLAKKRARTTVDRFPPFLYSS
jgi:SAM-dependent methyltransferase